MSQGVPMTDRETLAMILDSVKEHRSETRQELSHIGARLDDMGHAITRLVAESDSTRGRVQDHEVRIRTVESDDPDFASCRGSKDHEMRLSALEQAGSGSKVKWAIVVALGVALLSAAGSVTSNVIVSHLKTQTGARP